MSNDSRSSVADRHDSVDDRDNNVDGNGDSMIEELVINGRGRSLLDERRFVLGTAGDLRH